MIVSKVIDLKATELSAKEWETLFKRLTFFDNEGREVKAYRLLKNARVRLPRGAWSLLPDHVEYVDARVLPEGKRLRFARKLDAKFADKSFEGQQDALNATIREEQGLVIAQPGFGKTNVALAFVAQSDTPALVLVHTVDIFEQWVKNIHEAVPDAKIGRIQGPRWTVGDITVAMIQTIRDEMTKFRREYADKFGTVIIDEAHHAPANTWEMILNSLPAKYRLGFTATETRADGLHPLMRALIGPVIYKQKISVKVPTKVHPLKSDFKFQYRGRWDWQPMLNALVRDEKRNRMIAETALRQMSKGRSVLILSRRIEHLEKIEAEMLFQWRYNGADFQQQVTTLTGKIGRVKRVKMLDEFRAGKLKCILATQLADEALDVPRLACVILTHPGKHDGRIIQQVGRALREHHTKDRALIFDVVDDKIGPLRKQWVERKKAYAKMGIPVKKYKGEEESHFTSARRRRELASKVQKKLTRNRAKRQIQRR